MNAKQRWIILVGVACLLFLALYVPWKTALHSKGEYTENPIGYALIFSPPKTVMYWTTEVDLPRLLVPLATVLLATIAGAVVARD